MTSDELSAKVAEARGEKRKRNPIRARQLGGAYFGSEDEFLPWPKPYTTCMNAAWELVEEMGVMSVYPHSNQVTFTNHMDEAAIVRETTMPRAICRAYLAWKGVE